MEIHKQIDEKLKKLYEEFKEDKEDLTGWSLYEAIHKESGHEFEFLMAKMFKRLYELNFENKEIIIASRPLKEFVKLNSVYFNAEYIFRTKNAERNKKNILHYSQGAEIQKDIMVKILEKLELEKTLKSFCEYIMFMDERIHFEISVSKEKLEEFKSFKDPYELVIKIFEKEIEEKDFYKKQQRILKFE